MARCDVCRVRENPAGKLHSTLSVLLAKLEDGGPGYAVEDLAQIPRLSVPFSGLRH